MLFKNQDAFTFIDELTEASLGYFYQFAENFPKYLLQMAIRDQNVRY